MNPEAPESELQSALSERYTDFSKVGEGGMAVVYKARDTILLRDVAIKTLRIKNMTPDMVTRFQREARTAGKLQHPNVVTVLDFGMSEQIPYLIMDYAAGETLASVIEKKKRLRFREAVAWASEVCRGMAFAHANGVVHRDLKPSNIIILSQPEPDARVKIVDFGIGKIVQSLTGDTESGVATGAHQIDGRISNSQLIGSPFFMSPEQIRGEVIDARSDIYSFGCTLYQMLTGRVPFRGETKLETFNLHLNGTPSPIMEKGVPQQLADLTLNCLEKKPEDRPASMAEISQILTKCLDASDQSPEASDGDSSNKKASYKNIVAVIAVGVLLTGAVVMIMSRNKPTRTSLKAELKKQLVQKVQKVTDRKWRLENKNGREVWTAEANLTDAELITVIDQNARFINIKQAKITNAGLDSLASLPIEDLDLNETKLDDSAAQHLSRFKKLNQLCLSHTDLTDRGLARLELPSLVHLELDGLKGVTDQGLETVVARWPNLIFLNISNTSVTSGGLRKLKLLRRLAALEVAELTLDDDAMQLITSMPLNTLNLNQSRFAKKWLDKIAQMKTLESLTLGNLQGCKLKDYADLKARMPGCKFRCLELTTEHLPEIGGYLEMMDEGVSGR
jgi:Serine/threonine protein kinase